MTAAYSAALVSNTGGLPDAFSSSMPFEYGTTLRSELYVTDLLSAAPWKITRVLVTCEPRGLARA